jgi:UDP-N-acetylmuramyl pentapeptide phosphotransferase/UDP-N-acetylglucosamine-1-phosphate transferase
MTIAPQLALSLATPIVAAALSAGLIVLLRPWLRRYALAQPNARSSHREPTPQGGGIAVMVATIAVAALACRSLGSPDAASLAWVLLAAAFIAVVGAVDDIWTMGVPPRLALQAAAVAIVVTALPDDLRLMPMLPVAVERGLLLIAGLWIVNLTNFMDGIDWMTVAEAVPVLAGLVIIGLLDGLPQQATTVALALCGALLGFAPFNRPVAKLFLGDVGSLPIGLLLAWLLALLAGAGHVAAALILPLYYLADATITLLRRLVGREPFWQAHRTHFYQRATDRGLSVGQIVARVFAVNVGLVALAVLTVLWPSALNAAAALAGAAALVAWLLFSFARGRS